MKYISFIVIMMLSCTMLVAQEKRALLIGIGDYPHTSGWSTIHGHNDVKIIHEALIEQGFHENNISKLIDSSAIYVNIVKALQTLLNESNKGDVVYIQFSGHGQRITDQDGDEEDGYDESWVPYDAHKSYVKGEYEGERHITDDFLYDYLTKLRTKVGANGKIVVIADACHSGSGSRTYEDDDVFKRGSTEKFIIPSASCNLRRKEKPVDWLFVAACKSYQTNYEYKDEHGNYYGSLSYCISKSNEQLANASYLEAVGIWSSNMQEIISYPQDIDSEGRPSKKSSNLF